jgi:hypothetical protein
MREYFSDGTNQTSIEWAILPYDHKSGVFSAAGDSGSIIADTYGRIGGLLTGGAGNAEPTDITYATPFFWLLQRSRPTGSRTPTSIRSWTRRWTSRTTSGMLARLVLFASGDFSIFYGPFLISGLVVSEDRCFDWVDCCLGSSCPFFLFFPTTTSGKPLFPKVALEAS